MEKKIWLDKLRAEDRDTVFSMTSDPALIVAFRITTLQKAWKVYSICSRYSSVQVMENPPFLPKGLWLVSSCFL